MADQKDNAPRRKTLDELTDTERQELGRIASEGKAAFRQSYEQWKAEREKSA
jgi:hypothetical protein